MTKPMIRIFKRLADIAFYGDVQGLKFMLALGDLFWALTLLWPGSTFHREPYTVMATFLDETSWGVLFLLMFGLQMWMIVRTGQHDRADCSFAFSNAVMWLFVVASMYLSVSPPPPAALSGNAVLALAAGWVWVRSGTPQKERRRTDYAC